MTQTCPPAEDLRSLVDGSLSDIEAQPLELHIDRCETCQRALQELVADGTFWQSAKASLSDDKIEGPGLERVIETLQHQSREDAEEIGEAIELKLSFIEPPVEPGTIGRLRHYDILRVAGRGGMGIVLKAFDRSLRRVVAIKLLAPHLAGNGQARQRFVREGRAAAAITHEHVVTIHAVEESPPFLVMQYVHGETLEARIHRNGSLDVREAVRIALQIAQGLAAAHAQGVVHRDIKPANILLENGVARVRITDFGLARAVDDASLTQSGVVAGTPQYMAPEQANGDAIDERADLFSLGSVLYTMLVGHAPFRATTAMGVLKRLCDNAARPIREVNPETPDWLVVLINRLHAKRPADRFHSAGEVAALLERGLAAMQTGATMPVSSARSEAPTASGRAPDVRVNAMSFNSAPTEDTVAQGVSTKTTTPVHKRLIPSFPLWLLFAFVGLMVTPFVLQAGILAGVFAAVALLAPRIFPNATSKLLNGSTGPNGEAVSTSSDSSAPMPRKSFVSIGGTRLFVWGLLWVLPALIWKQAFFLLETMALSGSSSALHTADEAILMVGGAVFAGWLVIAFFWFRQKHGDGASMFSSPVRRKGILTTAGLAAIFCACGYGTWHSDVFWLGTQRVALQNRNYPMPVNIHLPQSTVRIEFEEPKDGISIIINHASNQITLPATSETLTITLPGSAGTFPWRSTLGQTTFAKGEVTLEAGRTALIKVPRPKLIDLIAGRWKHVPGQVEMGPGGGPAPTSDTKHLEFEFNNESAIIADRTAGQTSRSDLTMQIDESVTPALITLIDADDNQLVGIIRFEPHAVQSGSPSGGMGMSSRAGMMSDGGYEDSMGMGSSGGMMGSGDMGQYVPAKDRLLICISQGGFLRPWQFEADPEHGIELFELIRSDNSDSLHSSLVLEPLPTGTTAKVVQESVEAWSQRLKVPTERRNSIGMDLTLVPPAFVALPPGSALRDQRLLLPASQKIVNQNSAIDASSMGGLAGEMPSGAALKPMVSYPFVMSRDVISIGQFQQFVAETGYVTDAERGEPLTRTKRPSETSDSTESAAATESAVPVEDAAVAISTTATSIGGWQRQDGKFVWQDGLSWKISTQDSAVVEGDFPSIGEEKTELAATVLSLRDATEFCKWLTTKENRQYRLPTAQEWTAAIQLGGIRLPTENESEEYLEYRKWFDAQKSNPLNIRTPREIFGEWTLTTESMMGRPTYNVIVRKEMSPDGRRFDLGHQAIAPPSFRSSEISFRVVTELQALTPNADQKAYKQMTPMMR